MEHYNNERTNYLKRKNSSLVSVSYASLHELVGSDLNSIFTECSEITPHKELLFVVGQRYIHSYSFFRFFRDQLL